MFASVPRFLRPLLAVLCLFTAALKSAASDAHFTEALSPADQSASGIGKLSREERAALEAQIDREITLARQGDVVAFAKTFSERRTPAQTSAAGLNILTAAERARLDTLIARAVAQRPARTIPRLSAKPADADTVETVTYRPQLHGEVSLTYGMASGGRNFYGGSFTTIYDDPAHHLTVAFTYAEYHGKGLLPFYGDQPFGCVR